MSITIQKKGIQTTIQDLGRNGFRKFGINPNGAMDKTATRLINILQENKEKEAILEMHFPAPEIKFNENAIFALGGANFAAKLNDKRIENWQIHYAEKDSVLKFTDKIKGNRCYLSVKGGFKVEKWLESSSTNLTAEIGGFDGRMLEKDDTIFFNSKFKFQISKPKQKIARSIIPRYSKFPTLRFISGAEFSELTALSELNFLDENFKISKNSNRMGFQFDGKPLHLLNELELVSSAVDFGTIQLLPNGQLVILMADHQTTGGYPRIGQIIEKDLPLIAQLGAGDAVGFQKISIEDAEKIKIQFEKDLSFLKMGVKFNNNANN